MEAHMLEVYRSLYLGQVAFRLLICDLGLRVENFKYSLRARDIGHELVIEIAQMHNGHPEHSYIRCKCNECSDLYIFDSEDLHSDIIHRDESDRPADIGNGSEQVCPAYRVDKAVVMLLDKAVKCGLSFLFGIEALDNLNARDILMDERVEVGILLSEILPALVRAGLNGPDARDHDRKAPE